MKPATPARLLLIAALVGASCYTAWRVLGRSRLGMPALLVVAVTIVWIGSALWRDRRRAIAEEAHHREVQFWRRTIPRPASDSQERRPDRPTL